jgi:hypothetical protein
MQVSVHRPDRIAHKALDALKLPLADHQLLAENLANYTSYYKPEFQDQLDRLQGPELLDKMQRGWALGERRWVDKIERDLRKPYSDHLVQQHFEQLESRFQEESQRLVREHQGAFPAQVYVTGSLVKGRFGAHSDIDAIGVSQGGYRPSQHGAVSWQLTDDRGQDFLLQSFVEARPVEPGQSLLDLYRQGLQNKGINLTVEQGRWHIERRSFPERSPEPVPQTSMMWSFSDLP